MEQYFPPKEYGRWLVRVYFRAGLYERALEIVTQYNLPEQLDTLDEELVGRDPVEISRCYEEELRRQVEDLNLCKRFEPLWGVGNSYRMRQLYQDTHEICLRVQRYPGHLPNVMITGKTGSGKGLLAKVIHTLEAVLKPCRGIARA